MIFTRVRSHPCGENKNYQTYPVLKGFELIS